jgi:hypothetical protein
LWLGLAAAIYSNVAESHPYGLVAYPLIGFALFLFLLLTGGILEAGWSNASGKPIATGGIFAAFWWCVAFWLPLLLVLLASKAIPANVKIALKMGAFGAIALTMFLWPVAFVVYLIAKAVFHRQ